MCSVITLTSISYTTYTYVFINFKRVPRNKSPRMTWTTDTQVIKIIISDTSSFSSRHPSKRELAFPFHCHWITRVQMKWVGLDFLCLVHSDFLIFPRVEKSSIRHSCWKPNVGGWRCILVILVEWPSTGSLPDKYNTPYQCINLIHVFVVTSLCNLFK